MPEESGSFHEFFSEEFFIFPTKGLFSMHLVLFVLLFKKDGRFILVDIYRCIREWRERELCPVMKWNCLSAHDFCHFLLPSRRRLRIDHVSFRPIPNPNCPLSNQETYEALLP